MQPEIPRTQRCVPRIASVPKAPMWRAREVRARWMPAPLPVGSWTATLPFRSKGASWIRERLERFRWSSAPWFLFPVFGWAAQWWPREGETDARITAPMSTKWERTRANWSRLRMKEKFASGGRKKRRTIASTDAGSSNSEFWSLNGELRSLARCFHDWSESRISSSALSKCEVTSTSTSWIFCRSSNQYLVSLASFEAIDILDKKSFRLWPAPASSRLAPARSAAQELSRDYLFMVLLKDTVEVDDCWRKSKLFWRITLSIRKRDINS